MGAKGNAEPKSIVSFHHDILSNIIGSKEEAAKAIHHSYKYSFSGFSAWLDDAQVESISKIPEVISVFPNAELQLYTTRSWDFLGFGTSKIYNQTGSDVVIGHFDTGVWPESESFNDAGMGPVPAKWKGKCDNSKATNSSYTFNCNKKLIGAHDYSDGEYGNARDDSGHGTHTASTAAGRVVEGANAQGLAKGAAQGGLPTARIAVYKVCATDSCFTDSLLAAFDDAINDGVDIITISLGYGSEHDLAVEKNAIAIGSFHAMQRGILVACAGGNDGPPSSTVTNGAPWIFTVGASTIDRKFAVDIKLGNEKTIQGTAVLFNNGTRESRLISGADAAAETKFIEEASYCTPSTLDPEKIAGKILLCKYYFDLNGYSLYQLNATPILGTYSDQSALEMGAGYSGSLVSVNAMEKILKYMKTSSNATASISSTKVIIGSHIRAPIMADFSARGPYDGFPDILKPDVIAPGVNILAAIPPSPPEFKFDILSGTSMACPHVAGAAAFVKSIHPDWSPAAIRSALMTTASVVDNMNSTIRDFDGDEASPFAFGAGHINPIASVNPGLVYDLTPDDYARYLCSKDSSYEKLRTMTGVRCQNTSASDSQLNYPSITIPDFGTKGHTTIIRTVTNVGPKASTYKVLVAKPSGILVKVTPEVLEFNSTGQKLTFQVEFGQGVPFLRGWKQGFLSWTHGRTNVTSVFLLNLR